jgi:type II secretion system protein G
MKRNSKGFTLIELLIVVAIIGIIVAIAIPNLLNAIQRAKQRRTMGDERSIATAIEAYAIDFNRYPSAAAAPTIGYTGLVQINTNMSAKIAPTYIKTCPLSDGWNSWFMVSSDNAQEYLIASAGKDGVTAAPTAWGAQTNFNDDIIFSNGQFIAYPEGVQN